jgi:hypothetical protein
MGQQIVLPTQAREIIMAAYKKMADPRTSPVERDVLALAIARMLHDNFWMTGAAIGGEWFLARVISRLEAIEQGGRSYTFAALASFLHRLPFGSEFQNDLEKVIIYSIRSGRFINPEFGFLMGALLYERFGRDHMGQTLHQLATEVINDPYGPQTEELGKVARRMIWWLDAKHKNRPDLPPGGPYSDERLHAAICRPLRGTAEIFTRAEEVETVAIHTFGDFRQISRRDRDWIDQYIRRNATKVYADWTRAN